VQKIFLLTTIFAQTAIEINAITIVSLKFCPSTDVNELTNTRFSDSTLIRPCVGTFSN